MTLLSTLVIVVLFSSSAVVDSAATTIIDNMQQQPPQQPSGPDLPGQFMSLLFKLFSDGVAGSFAYLVDSLGGEHGIYFFLVYLPVVPDPSSSSFVTSGSSSTDTVGLAIQSVFASVQNISLVFYVFVLTFAGLSYAFESIRIMKEGTASTILSESLVTLVLMFVALPIYNTAASMINVITTPDSNLILRQGDIMGIIKSTISPPAVDPAQTVLSSIMSVFVFILDLLALVSIAVFGALHIFFVGALVAVLPLLLVLRLLPLTRNPANSLIEMLVGLVLSSLMAAIFLRFGFEVSSQWGGLLSTLAGFGTLVSASLMPTVLAPRIGNVFSSTAGIVATAATGATVMGAFAGAGALASGMSVVQAAGGLGKVFGSPSSSTDPISSRIVGYTSGLRIVAPAMLAGGARGAGRGLAEAVKGIRVGPDLMPAGIRVQPASLSSNLQTIRERAPYSTALLHLEGRTAELAFTPIQGESAGHGWKFIEKVSSMDEEALAIKLADALGEPSLKQNPRRTAARFKESVGQFKTNPLLASRVSLNLEKFEQTGPPPKEAAASLIHNKNKFNQRLNKENAKLREQKRASERTLRFTGTTPVSLSSLFPDDEVK
ncbi:hypothetical protein NWT39_12665 [Nitrososphaera viennensis]|uniref:Transmembrane protein n=1 Tax=Nitrososphaera viennensis TaxID=1034015 RepID=A0A977ID15_9ARCH|nr:hypothetical protein [Nitrososphaera viennensis]UVS68744.1 hypothetical protein NWT39_12665 [Nitrososphaera viennensis]